MIKNSTKMKASQSILSRFSIYLSSLQSLSHVPLFVAPWTAAWQASLSITNSQSLPKLTSIGSAMPSNRSSPVPFSSCLQLSSQHQSFHRIFKVFRYIYIYVCVCVCVCVYNGRNRNKYV